VSLCQNVAHLVPRDCQRQRADDSVLSISPDPAVIEDRVDYFGNPVCYFTIQEQHRELTVSVTHRVEVWATVPPVANTTPAWELIRDRLRFDHSPPWLDAYQYTFDSRYVAADPRYAAYALHEFKAGRPIVEAVLDLTRRIHSEFIYDPRATNLTTPVAEVFENRRGVCQDFAHLMLACLRSIGLASRYVSGYLSTQPPPGKPRLVGADATHAWVSVYCGEIGWVDFDPTNNQIPGDRYVLLAWGRDYEDVSPLKGVILGGGQHVVRVSVDVRAEVELPALVQSQSQS